MKWQEREKRHVIKDILTSSNYNQAYYRYLQQCENFIQQKMFSDWWYGKNVYDNNYRAHIPLQDYAHTSSVILQALDEGFGH